MSLLDEHTGVVDGLGQAKLVDTSLEPTLQEILNLQRQHVVEFHTGLVKHTNTNEATNQGISFEESLWVLLVEGKQLTVRASARYPPLTGRVQFCRLTERHDESWKG